MHAYGLEALQAATHDYMSFTCCSHAAHALHEFISKVAFNKELIFTIVTLTDIDAPLGGFFINMVWYRLQCGCVSTLDAHIHAGN